MVSQRNSKRFHELVKNIERLNNHLLPAIKPAGNYSQKEQTLMRSHRILLHAELESYFEDIAKNKAIEAVKKYQTKQIAGNVLTSICAFSQKTNVNYPEKFYDGDSPEKYINTRINDEISHFLGIIKANNGILQKDLCKILLPLGLSENDFEQDFLNDLDTFGRERGEVAHNSLKTKSEINPIDVLTAITRWTQKIQDLDKKIIRLK